MAKYQCENCDKLFIKKYAYEIHDVNIGMAVGVTTDNTVPTATATATAILMDTIS